MTFARKFKNGLRNGITWLSSGISLVVLVAIFTFIISRGWSAIDWSLLSGDYLATSILATSETGVTADAFEPPAKLEDGAAFSESYGFALKDDVNRDNEHVQTIVYVDHNSPLKTLVVATAGDTQGQPAPFETDMTVSRIEVIGADGEKTSHGHLKGESAADLVAALDEAQCITGFQAKKPGGGIRGSLMATFLLIILSMLISMPIALGAAIYLQRVAKDNKLTRMVRASINLLAGVPSIIFGMMGITIIYPLIAAVGVEGNTILLGAFTMAVLLLPVLIRQTEEALLAVPLSYTMASYALGATETQTLVKVVLPAAMPGILSAFLLGISRVVGESAALIFTMGTAIQDKVSVTGGATSLAVHIWVLMGGENPNFRLASAISIIILVFVLLLNITVKLIVSRFNQSEKTERKKKYGKKKQTA